MSAPDVLVVGAGAVGQAYALAVRRAGVPVHFFVKPHHVEALQRGVPVQEVGLFATGPCTDLADLPLHTDWRTVAERPWHSIWLAVDSTALRGAWVADLAAARGDATVLSFQTGTSGRDHLARHIPPDALVSGMIPFLAWWAPLPGAAVPPDGPCMRVWHPPGMKTPLSGPLGRVSELARLLDEGGIGARVVASASVQGAMGSAILLPTIAGLEVAGWQLRALTRGPAIQRVVAAIHEARSLVATLHGQPPPLDRFLRPALFQLGARLAPRLAHLELETYLRVHFTKVGAQTAASLDDLLAAGARAERPLPALTALRSALAEARARTAPPPESP